MTTDCPSENTLVEFAEGRLSIAASQGVHQHIDVCSECRALVSDLACVGASPAESTAFLTPPSQEAVPPVVAAGMPVSQRFQILRKLGQGGMGVVYEAIDRQHQSRVALKTLRSLTPDALLRFKNEFRVLQDLEHRNLVRLGDLVEESGQWWFTMELLAGRDFLTWVKGELQPDLGELERIRSEGVAETLDGSDPSSEPPSPLLVSGSRPQAVSLDLVRLRAGLLQLGEGLDALHRAGKVHRDIKPQNVMVTAAGRVVILDFGLVFDRSQQDSAVVGTLSYMAPEQAAGEPAGSAADWYSVGVMLYEALTGSLPNPVSRLELLRGTPRGLSPSPKSLNPDVPDDLDTLCRELLDGNPLQRPGGEALLRRLRSGTEQSAGRPEILPAPSSASPLFVGRQAELARLHTAFARSRAGQAALLLIEGESGVGKSALVRQFLLHVRSEASEAVVLSGRCYEREAVPYKAFDGIIDALSRYLKRVGKDRAAAFLPRRASSLLPAFPVLGMVPAMAEVKATTTEALDPKEQRTRVFAALRELYARLSERHPLVLWIDDLQWSDADSLALLTHLMSPPDAPPLLLLCTLRPLTERRPDGLSEAVLQKLGSVERMQLGPLQLADACELAEKLVGQDPGATRAVDVKAIAEEAGGHPLFLDELIRRAQEAPEQTAVLRLEDAIWARVSSLPETAQRLLRLFALAARPLRSEVVVAASALSAAECAEWVARLQSARLLRKTPRHESNPGSAVEPYHDRVRETIAERLDEAERRELHRALATALELEPDAEPELLAIHYQSAGELAKSGRYAAQAAAQAAQKLAFDRAAALYRSALSSGAFSIAEQSELAAALGEALTNAGHVGEAGRAYLVAAEHAELGRALELRKRAANQFLRGGHVDEGEVVVSGLLQVFGLRVSTSRFWVGMKCLGLFFWLWLRGTSYRLRAESEIPPQELFRYDLCWMINQALTSGSLKMLGYDYLPRSILYGLRLGEPRRVAQSLAWLSYSLSTLRPMARTPFGQLFARARTLLAEQKIDDPYTEGFVDQMESWACGERGLYRRSRELSERAEQTFLNRCFGATWELTNVRFARLWISGFMGEFALLGEEMPRLLRECRERNDRNAINLLGCVNGHGYFLAADDKDQAERTLRDWGLLDPAANHLSHSVYYVLAGTQFALYFEGGRAGYRRYLEAWHKVDPGVRLMTTQALKTKVLLTGVVCRLAASVESTGREKEQHLAACDKVLRRAGRSRLAWVDAWTLALRASLMTLRGQRQEGIALLRKAIPAFEAVDFYLHAAVCRRRLGEVLADDEGKALIAQAEAWMHGQTIRNPARLARAWLPGFDNI